MMTKKQKRDISRIIITAVLIAVLSFLPVAGFGRFVLYMIP